MTLPDDWFEEETGQSRVLNVEKVEAEIERLQAALRDLIDAYIADVNPNDRNETAIEHARRHLEQTGDGK